MGLTVATSDMLSPDYSELEKIVVTKDITGDVFVFNPITINFDYSACETATDAGEGVIVPMELILQPNFGDGGAGGGYINKIFRRNAPSSFTFTVPGAGFYLIVIKEIFHNRWWGRLRFEVQGDQFSTVDPIERIE
jgi:hypothetical protein